MPSKRPRNNVTLNNIPVEYTYFRKRPNIARNNKTVKLPMKPYNARTLNTWIKMGKHHFPDNRQTMSTKEMYEIRLAVTVPRANRKKYKLLMNKKQKLTDSLFNLRRIKANLDAKIKTTQDNIGSSNKEMNMLLRDEFRSNSRSSSVGSPVVSHRASPRRSHHASPESNPNNVNLDALQRILEGQ
tara:strand:- start:1682 stop:2236 length:555 start_codon:yes stop_codon:yes gene_type:complete